MFRFARLVGHLVKGVFLTAAVLPRRDEAARDRIIRDWSAHILRILAIEVRVRGELVAGRGELLVANHVSWLDIWAILGKFRVRFVSKDDVRAWPVIGWLAQQTGTLFIDRARRHHTATINQQIRAHLEAGECVALFPEGTTTDGLSLHRFFTSLFQPVANSGIAVRPVALRYVLPNGETDPDPAYTGDMSLFQSLKKVLSRRRIAVEMTVLPPIASAGHSRRELAGLAEAAIAAALNFPAPRTRPETPLGLPA